MKTDHLMEQATREDLFAEILRLRERNGQLVAENAILKSALAKRPAFHESRSSHDFRPARARRGKLSPAAVLENFALHGQYWLAVERALFAAGQLEQICARLNLSIEPHDDDDLVWVRRRLATVADRWPENRLTPH